MQYDFDNNELDNTILNGADNNHSINEFNNVDCDVSDLDNLDFGLDLEGLDYDDD